MSRSVAMVLSVVCALVAPGLPALAQTDATLSPADEILSTLLSRGYSIVQDERTWLGRQRVVAEKDGTRREIVFMPGTGEILRDYSVRLDGGTALAAERGGAASVSTESGGGSGVTGTADATPSVSVGDAIGIGRDSDNKGDVAVGSAP